ERVQVEERGADVELGSRGPHGVGEGERGPVLDPRLQREIALAHPQPEPLGPQVAAEEDEFARLEPDGLEEAWRGDGDPVEVDGALDLDLFGFEDRTADGQVDPDLAARVERVRREAEAQRAGKVDRR